MEKRSATGRGFEERALPEIDSATNEIISLERQIIRACQYKQIET
jgi:hypothetical protein